MLDYDLAEIYGYEVKRLNEQVKRNVTRFPEDFMFQLTKDEIPEDFSKLSVTRFLKGVDWEALIEQKSVSARHEMEILYPQRRIVRFYLVPHGKDGHFIVILADITEEYDKTASRMESERGRVVSMLAAGVDMRSEIL